MKGVNFSSSASNVHKLCVIGSPVDRATAYEMEISAEKGKIMTNSMNNIRADNSMNCQKIEEVTSFKYLGATL